MDVNDRVITRSFTVVYETPSRKGKALGRQKSRVRGTVSEGTVLAERYKWAKVTFDEGLSGWIMENYLIKTGVLNRIPRITSIPIVSEPILSGIVTVEGTAIDDAGIKTAYLTTDIGPTASKQDFVPPSTDVSFSLPIDTRNYPDGNHVLTVYVQDGMGSTCSFSWYAEFQNGVDEGIFPPDEEIEE